MNESPRRTWQLCSFKNRERWPEGWQEGTEAERADRKRDFERKERRVNSRPLRHTREKTERARQLVLVYGSQNELGREDSAGTVPPAWLRGQPEIVAKLSRMLHRATPSFAEEAFGRF